MSNGDLLTIEELPDPEEGARWGPVVGPETTEFLDIVPENSRETIRNAAVAILGRGVPPVEREGQETGLVVGYVQSGKTMSFETVAALARDNAYRMVVVLAGSSNPLLAQSAGRLRQDLRLDAPGRERRWIHFQNPGDDASTIQAIRDVLEDWEDPGTPDDYRKTVLVTVLKHHRRLQNLTAALRTVGLDGSPVLIIDDEADQASLNTEVAQGTESTTYRSLMELRGALPHHTYLQYTATPQAPLLVSIIDSLSPNFVRVLEPGPDYVGGTEFFVEYPELVRIIPPQEVPTNANVLTEPPPSLLEALRLFMVGVAVGLRESHNAGNRSMLVHPSQRTAQHQEYVSWVRDVFDEWRRVLALPEADSDRQELLEEFRESYEDLAETVDGALPPIAELPGALRLAFRHTRILEVNARASQTPTVDWRNAYGWILVGGQAMDRGFTVEGLTVTYMPRNVGVGNADTVQQRARFFGYKRRYLGFCRVYLEQGTLNAFESYVEHEEDIREQLSRYQDEDRPLDDWKRAFVLDQALRPCRQQVLLFDYMQNRFDDEWVVPRVIRGSAGVLEANRAVVEAFVRGLEFQEDDGHADRTVIQRHEVVRDVPLQTVLSNLLVRLRVTGITDSQRNTGLLLQLSRAIEDDPHQPCTVFRISPGARRHRGVDDGGEVTNLFQGEAPVHPRDRRGEVYPGDRAIRDDDTVTVQIHTLNLTQNDNVVEDGVLVVAVWVPARLALPWLAQ